MVFLGPRRDLRPPSHSRKRFLPCAPETTLKNARDALIPPRSAGFLPAWAREILPSKAMNSRRNLPRERRRKGAELRGSFSQIEKILSQNSSVRGCVCPTLGKTDMDSFDSTQRSDIMRRVRSSGTQPEMTVRSIVRRMGVHYRSCPRNLPGKPDLVIPDQRKAILLHGCSWHGHCCEAGKLPKSNRSYWRSKQSGNARRDLRNARALRSKGWRLMTVWECQIRGNKRLESRLSRFLGR